MSTATESTAATAGLRGVVAAQSAIGDVNGEQGILIYQGYDIHDLAEHSTFEEVIFLLWNGRLPKADELADLKAQISANYEAPAAVIELMKQFPKEAEPMDVLRTSVSMLDFYDSEGHGTDREHALKAAIKLTAQIGTLVTAWERIRTGQEIVAPDKSLSIAEHFLYTLRGKKSGSRRSQNVRHRAHPARRPRAQRFDLYDARHCRNSRRRLRRGDGRHRGSFGTAARRREHQRHENAHRDRR